jgi:protein-S-isoprenylcysteine O-methyltransferase Ste14
LYLESRLFIFYLYVFFVVFGPIYYSFFAKGEMKNKSYTFLRLLRKIILGFWRQEKVVILKEERVAVLFLLVKFFYVPLMINFVFQNSHDLLFVIEHFSLFSFILILFFTVDTFIFAFGYLVESYRLKNVVKSVEPTFLGWFVALICYPPFNGLVGRYVPWGANDYALFWSPYWTMVFRILIVALFFIYVLSSVVLGFKASNLTNRGIVTRFPYSLVRHPAYISKNMVWWITLLPVMNWWFFFGMLFWTTIYVLRALTEERHLLSDPDYILYCEKVRYRFIPGLV